jgi:hypothetical protein
MWSGNGWRSFVVRTIMPLGVNAGRFSGWNDLIEMGVECRDGMSEFPLATPHALMPAPRVLQCLERDRTLRVILNKPNKGWVMVSKVTSVIGLRKSDFDDLVKEKVISLRRARLIPTTKPGDEVGLTSILLSSFRLIKEFRSLALAETKVAGGGQVFAYTEVSFSQFPESRFDGLLLVVKAGVIKDATIWEMKNGKSELEKEQIERYLQIAKALCIPRIITVSNQFTSSPKQSPLQLRQVKSVDLYHLSWSYLLTISHVLLVKNETNIEDADQVEMMKEVVYHLEHKNSGVCGFSQMKKGWAEVATMINSGARLRPSDKSVQEAVLSWHQEEQDVGLILSQKLGVLVNSGNMKFQTNLQGRLDFDTKNLIDNNKLNSTHRIRGAVSDMSVEALFQKRTIEMCVSLKPPSDKKLRGQIGWMKRQFTYCNKKAPKTFSRLQDALLLEIWLKNMRTPERLSVAQLDEVHQHLQGRTIKEFRVVLIEDFGKNFGSRIKFVERIEQMAIDFYSGVVQYLVKWEQTAPKLAKSFDEGADSDEPSDASDIEIIGKEVSALQADPAPTQRSQVKAEDEQTAPCPQCEGDLILTTLQVGANTCPHCSASFDAE